MINILVFGCTTKIIIHVIPITIICRTLKFFCNNKRLLLLKKAPPCQYFHNSFQRLLSLFPIVQIKCWNKTIWSQILAISAGCSCCSNGSLIHLFCSIYFFSQWCLYKEHHKNRNKIEELWSFKIPMIIYSTYDPHPDQTHNAEQDLSF